MTTEALAPRKEASLLPVEGLEGTNQSDVTIPRLQIVQPTSPACVDDGVQAGQFRNILTEEVAEQLTIVPFIIKPGRACFEEGERDLICKSDDGLVPSSQIETPINEICAEIVGNRRKPVCPKAIWDDRTPPDCSEGYTLLAIDLNDGFPFLINLRGTSYKPTKKLNTVFALKRKPLYTHSCFMSLKKTKNKMGTFYVVNFSKFEALDPPDQYREMFLSLKQYDVQKTYDAEIENGAGEQPSEEGMVF